MNGAGAAAGLCADNVCRVPNDTSPWMVASIRRRSISASSARSSLSGRCPPTGRPGPPLAAAGVAADPATAAPSTVAADAESTARRVDPARTPLSDMTPMMVPPTTEVHKPYKIYNAG